MKTRLVETAAAAAATTLLLAGCRKNPANLYRFEPEPRAALRETGAVKPRYPALVAGRIASGTLFLLAVTGGEANSEISFFLSDDGGDSFRPPVRVSAPGSTAGAHGENAPRLLVDTSVAAQEGDGRILKSQPWPPLPSFESLDDFGRSYFPRAVYEEVRTQKEFDVLEITYASDGLPVRGMFMKPKAPGTRKWPAIIFNRGGNGELGRITDNGQPCCRVNTSCLDIADLYQFAKAGFVVIASDYRYQGATAKRDEWGGVEVDDVLNLVPALESLDFVDPERLYMLGLSRGGTMTYLAIQRGAPVKAAAVIGGVSDLKAWVDARPEMGIVNGNEYTDGFAKIWPDYEHRAGEHYRARSAVYWADQIDVPVLILHSRTDRLVPVTQALRMAEALQEKGKVYALHIYDRDGHPLPKNREDRDRMIVDWFNRVGPVR